MSTVEKTIAKFHIIVTPVVNNVDDNDDGENIGSLVENIPFNVNASSMDKSHLTTIKLRPEWAMVACHPMFKLEYKDYIRNY
jgi:hypothetical protein